MNLNTEQMVLAIQTFQDSLEYVLGNYDQTNRDKALAFCGLLLMEEKPYLLVTTEGIQHAMKLVFTSASRQDFIMTLSFVFFSRWGHSPDDFSGLVENLARGATQSGVPIVVVAGHESIRSIDYRATPEAIADRLTEYEDARLILSANQWLVVVLMIQLCISIPAITSNGKQK